MKCECGKDLICQTILTKLGNDIDLMECEVCGIVLIEDWEKERD